MAVCLLINDLFLQRSAIPHWSAFVDGEADSLR